ncbi:transcriptional regulatory [Fusarium globosum]|uniref:Transcriptional regulatory n=1 Tax=Fusarium globosum TaxID=78864 RepID=A0A8H5YPE6_9HYPO|nr:transcriptional regulatory [Fusarium globosum]
MVSPNCYSTDPRRFGPSRMNIFSYPERRGAAYPIHPDTRTTIMSERDDDVTPQRKRIAVACGRCRKRKIRCSGDAGNGESCTNCKNAGHEPCQFLRVASHEASIVKSEGFTYSLEASRQYQARGSSAIPSLPATAPAYADGVSSYTSDPFVYRAPTTYGYGAKPYCPLATWSHGYADDQSYYNSMYQAPYSSVHDSEYAISHRIASGAPGKSALCVDMEPNYAYSGPNSATSLVHRPAPVTTDSASLAYQTMMPDSTKSLGYQNLPTDSKSLGFQNMAASVNMGDRLLPAPVGRTALPNSMGSSYKNDSGSSIYGSSSSSKSSQASTSNTSPVSSTSEAPSSYTSYESSSMSSTSGCLPSYPTNLASQYGRQSNDYYSYTNSSVAPVLGPADSMRQGPEITYRYIDTTNSVTAAPPTTARRDMPTLNSGGISSFPLGHSNSHYMTHQSAAYMMPPGDLGSVGADAAADSYRKATGTLRA